MRPAEGRLSRPCGPRNENLRHVRRRGRLLKCGYSLARRGRDAIIARVCNLILEFCKMEVIMKAVRVSLIIMLALMCSVSAAGPVSFERIVVDRTFRAEGVATGDVNHDGRLDILSGDVWYAGPDFEKMHEVREVGAYDGTKGYSNCFVNFARDVNGDGWVDSIVIGMPGGLCLWDENPGNEPGHWKERTVVASACNETPIFADLLGNGKPAPVFGVRPEGQMAWFGIPEDIEGEWDMHVIDDDSGVGTQFEVVDINGDGTLDIVTSNKKGVRVFLQRP